MGSIDNAQSKKVSSMKSPPIKSWRYLIRYFGRKIKAEELTKNFYHKSPPIVQALISKGFKCGRGSVVDVDGQIIKTFFTHSVQAPLSP